MVASRSALTLPEAESKMVQSFPTQGENNETVNKKVAIRCKFCGSQDFHKEGYRRTQNRGRVQKYFCHSCKHYFTMDLGFYRMRNSESKITAAIDLYFSNLSSRKVRNHFRRHLDHNASHVTVLDWCRRYTLRVQKYVDTLQPQFSGEYYADETEIDCERRKDFLWCNVDWGTRYINGFHYSTTRDLQEAVTFLKKTTENKNLPKFIQTDAAKFYPKAMRKLFASNRIGKGISGVPRRLVDHKVQNTRRTKRYNVRIETVFSKIKDRVDDFRGLKALWSAPILLAGIVLQHNYIEAHTTTGRIPCELAGLDIKTGMNRWLGLIKLATIEQRKTI